MNNIAKNGVAGYLNTMEEVYVHNYHIRTGGYSCNAIFFSHCIVTLNFNIVQHYTRLQSVACGLTHL